MSVATSRRRIALDALPVLRVERRGDRHTLHDLLIDIRLELDPAADAASDPLVLAAAVRALSARHGADEPERFASVIARHCVDRFAGVTHTTVEVRSRSWNRLVMGGRPLDRDLTAPARELRVARVILDAAGERVAAGLRDMLLLTSVDAEASGVLLLRLDAIWTYGWTTVPFGTQWQQVRRAITEAYAERDKATGAHLAEALGRAVLEESPPVREVDIRLEAVRRPQIDLNAFGMENMGEVFDTVGSACTVHEVTVRRTELVE